jgi:hypothetical protein
MSCDTWKQQARHALQDICALSFDYDGCNNVKDLKSLMDSLYVIAKLAQKGEYSYTNDSFLSTLKEYQGGR